MALKDLPPIKPEKPQPSEFGITLEQYNKSTEDKGGCGTILAMTFLVGGTICAIVMNILMMAGADSEFINVVCVGIFVTVFILWYRFIIPPQFSEEVNNGIKEYELALKDYEPIYHEYLDLLRAYEETQKDWWFRLSGRRFEQEFERLIHSRGYKTDLTKATGDGGVDVRARKDGKTILIECKAWKDKVGVGIIRQLNGVREADEEAWVVGLGGFTKGAIEFAEQKSIQLYEYRDLAKWVKELQSEKFSELIKEQRDKANEVNRKKILAQQEWIKKNPQEEDEPLENKRGDCSLETFKPIDEVDLKTRKKAVERARVELILKTESNSLTVGESHKIDVLLIFPINVRMHQETDCSVLETKKVEPVLFGRNINEKLVEGPESISYIAHKRTAKYTFEITPETRGNIELYAAFQPLLQFKISVDEGFTLIDERVEVFSEIHSLTVI